MSTRDTHVALGDVAEVVSGLTKGRRTKDAVRSVPFLRAANLGSGALELDEIKEIDATDREVCKYRLQSGDVLLVEGSGSPQRLGQGWVWDGQLDVCLHQNHVFRARPDRGRLLPRYLAWYLQSPEARAYFLSVAKTTSGLNTINKRQVNALQVPLPSLERQQQIVETLDRLMALITEADSRLMSARGRLNEFVSAALNEAVETAEAAPVHQLGELSERVTSGSRDWKPYYERGTGVFVLTQNVRMRSLDVSEPFHVDPPADDPARARSAIKQEDLLVTIVGANCGNVARVPRALEEHYVCQSLALVRLLNPALSPWVELYMSAPAGGQKHFAEAYYGQGRPHLSFADIKKMPVPVPSPDVQRAVVSRFAERARAATELATTLDRAHVRTAELRLAGLRSAFGAGTNEFATDLAALDVTEPEGNKGHAVLAGR